ncbi:MAG TPA: RDD family protein [Mucilaginibacter sp.]|jgi:uncharacterized RDD family membrane protein YckC
MTDGYFILEDGEQTGPYTFDELTELEIDIHTRILPPNTDSWQDACDLPELYPYFEAQGIYLPTGDNLASFGWRFLAFIIDVIVLSFLMDFILGVLILNGVSIKLHSYNDIFKIPKAELQYLTLITLLTLIVYNAICEASPMRGSIGKRILKIVVVDIDGIRLSFFNALLRSIGKAASIYFLYLGFLSILFTEYRQAVHDLLAKTYVVKRD